MTKYSVLLVAVTSLSAACTQTDTQNANLRTPQAPAEAAGASAERQSSAAGATDLSTESIKAHFLSAANAGISGDAEFVALTDGVRIHIEVAGATPGEKGIHIHQTDNCSDIPNKSMGSHFSPQEAHHGLPSAEHHHLGDLGNIAIGSDGKGALDITVPHANLRSNDPFSFLGRSVVLHEGTDNGSGESGDSGHPVACAPIEPT